jgi:hypothetical protein
MSYVCLKCNKEYDNPTLIRNFPKVARRECPNGHVLATYVLGATKVRSYSSSFLLAVGMTFAGLVAIGLFVVVVLVQSPQVLGVDWRGAAGPVSLIAVLAFIAQAIALLVMSGNFAKGSPAVKKLAASAKGEAHGMLATLAVLLVIVLIRRWSSF